eukprot:g906.t1
MMDGLAGLEDSAADCIVQVFTAAVALEDSDNKTRIVTAALQALGHLAKALNDAQAGQVMPLILQMAQHSETSLVKDAVRTVALVAGESRDIALSHGAVETVAQVLQANTQDKEISEGCFSALAALAGSSDGAQKALAADVVSMCATWMTTNGTEAGTTDGISAALRLLAALASDPSNVATVESSGGLEAAKSALQSKCTAGTPNPKVLGGAASLFAQVAKNPDFAQSLVDGGGIANVIETAADGVDYQLNGSCMSAVVDLLLAVSRTPGLGQAVLEMGAKEVVIAAMASHPFNAALLKSGAETLAAMEAGAEGCGTPAEELAKSVEALRGGFDDAKANPEDPAMLQAMKGQLEDLGCRILMTGAADQQSAETLMPFLGEVLKYTLDVGGSVGEMASFAQQLLPGVVQAIGRLASLDGVQVDVTGALPQIMRAMGQQEDVVSESAMFCLGQIAENCDASAVKALSSAGAVMKISDALQKHRTRANAELREIAMSAMDKVKKALQSNAGALVMEEGGTDAMYALLEATAYDAVQLSECIEAIFIEDSGGNALLELMTGGDNFGVQAEVVKVLSQQSGREGVTIKVCNMEQLSGIVKTLQKASKIQHTQAGATKQQIAESASVAASSLSILSDATATESESVMLVEGGGIEGIVQVIRESAKNETTLVECVRVLCQLAAHESERVTTKLAEGGVVQALLEATKQQPDSADLAEFTIKLLQHMTRVVGVHECGINREGMQMVTRLIAMHQSNEFVQSEGPVLLSAIQQGLGGDAQTLAVKYAMESIAAAQIWQAVWDDGSNAHYYYNNSTQATQWDQPEEYKAMAESIHALETDIVYQNMDDSQIVAILLQAMREHGSANMEIVKSIVNMLSKMILDAETLNAFCQAPGAINAVVGILSANNYNPHDYSDMVLPCLSLIEKLSTCDTFKSMAAAAGTIETINYCMHQNMHQQEIAKVSSNIFVKLAYNSQTNMSKIVESGCVETVQSVMQSYPDNFDLLETSLCLLSNLMFESEDNKRHICNSCSEEILEIFRRAAGNTPVLKMALRCVGNLSTEDENISVIVHAGATQAIADSIEAQMDDEEFAQMAIEVIGNFASLEEDEEDDGRTFRIISEEGGCSKILEAMTSSKASVELLGAGLDALGNLANDHESTVLIVDGGGIPLIVDIIQSYDFNEELLEKAVHLLNQLTYYEEGCEAAAEARVLPVLLLSLKDHAMYGDFMHGAADVISQMCNHGDDSDIGEQSREAIRSNGGIDLVFGLLEQALNSQDSLEDAGAFMETCIKLVTKLSVDDEMSSAIANTGMHVLELVAREQFEDEEFLQFVFTLIAQLAFIPENLLAVVQYHGIELIFDSIEKHLRSEELMVKCIETLDHISMADEEYATIVFEAKGIEYVEEILKMYQDNEEVQNAGQSALVSMQAMQSLASAAPVEEENDDVVAELTEDPLKDHRSMLQGGAVMEEWVKGKPSARHVLIAADMQSIILKDAKKGKNAKKGLMMPLKSVKTIEKGLGKGHKKRMLGKKANDELAFNIIGVHDEVISLCTNSKGDCKRWVASLETLIDVYKNHRKWLVKQ